jgi:hypothetical protein
VRITNQERFVANLNAELAAFQAQITDLETKHRGQWVVFHGSDRVGVFEAFERAASEAVLRFGRGPYLIRQVGAPPIALPVCVVQRH